MKILQKIAIIAMVAVVFASCTKGFDKNFDLAYEEQSVELTAATSPVTSITVEPPATGNMVIDLGNISISTPKTTATPVTVNLVINNTLLSDYNNTNFTNLVPFPSSSINMPLTYVIPAGQKQIPITCIVDPTKIDLSQTYAIGVSIGSVTGLNDVTVNPVYKNGLFAFVIKNKYDGRYLLRGWHNRDPYTFPFEDVPMQLHTSGGNTVKFYWTEAAAYGHPIGIGPQSYSWYGTGVGPQITMDLGTNKITAATNVGAPTPPIDLSTSFNSDPRVIMSSNGKPSKVYVAFRYNANNLRSFIDTLTYVGAR
jgi:hypothetical protein